MAETKSLALKQISRGRFEQKDSEIISEILCLNEEIEIVFINKVSIQDFRKKLLTAHNSEPSIEFMYEEPAFCD